MLMGHTDGLSESRSSRDQLLPYAESDLGDDDTADCSEPILYSASFEELAKNIVKYDTVIWLSISLMLVLAWGVGIIMLLYLPFKRYILQKDISSRKLYVTPSEIVYKVSRPSYVPFLGITTIERHVPLSLVIDIIIEQGCLQSKYGLHTFRIESIARGKAAAVDELQVQGVSNPSDLRKVIITEASKVIQDSGISWKPTTVTTEGESMDLSRISWKPTTVTTEGESMDLSRISWKPTTVTAEGESMDLSRISWKPTTVTAEGESMARTPSVTEVPILRSPAKSVKMAASPRYASIERRSILPSELLLNRLEEVNKSVKKIEFLIEKSHTQPELERLN